MEEPRAGRVLLKLAWAKSWRPLGPDCWECDWERVEGGGREKAAAPWPGPKGE